MLRRFRGGWRKRFVGEVAQTRRIPNPPALDRRIAPPSVQRPPEARSPHVASAFARARCGLQPDLAVVGEALRRRGRAGRRAPNPVALSQPRRAAVRRRLVTRSELSPRRRSRWQRNPPCGLMRDRAIVAGSARRRGRADRQKLNRCAQSPHRAAADRPPPEQSLPKRRLR